MIENKDFETLTAQDEHVAVSIYPELLDSDTQQNELWAYCLRIENKSDEPIRLLSKEFCVTDNWGNNHYECTQGFHGQLPDLEPNECFEFEDTTTINGAAAVLYGTCQAVNSQGKIMTIKLPVVMFDSQKKFQKISAH